MIHPTTTTVEIGIEEWQKRLEEEEGGGILTVLGLHKGEGRKEREEIIKAAKEFLVKAWKRRSDQ